MTAKANMGDQLRLTTATVDDSFLSESFSINIPEFKRQSMLPIANHHVDHIYSLLECWHSYREAFVPLEIIAFCSEG